MMAPTFNLETPPGFRGLHPDIPVQTYQRRLPHWRQPGATYFVTFRLADSIPQQQLCAIHRWRQIWERSHPDPRSDQDWQEFAREITRKTERYLDEGYGECVFRHVECANEMSQSLLYFQNQRCVTFAFAVLPNHVHLVIKPLNLFELEDILASIKGFVSRKVNAYLGRHGELWEPESYDRIIRDDEHLFQVTQYVGRNPRRAGLPRAEWVRWIHPDWETAGWGFRDDD